MNPLRLDTIPRAQYNGPGVAKLSSYALIQTGGHQYHVAPGDIIDVEKLDAAVGSTLELTEVLLLSQDGQLMVGTPGIDGALVRAEVQEHSKDAKIIVFKYKAKTRYRRKQGHRQQFTRLEIKELVTPNKTRRSRGS